MMPLIVKDFTWRQSETTVYLTVKIQGIRNDKASFVTADNYIRLHYPPYYFEVFLWGEVDEVNGKCTLDEKESMVVFEMPKLTRGVEWPSLDLKNLSKTEKHEKRVRAVDLSQKRAAQELEKVLARRQEQKQASIHEQLRLDDEARRRIAAIKMFDTRTALEQLSDWERAAKVNPSSSEPTEEEEDDRYSRVEDEVDQTKNKTGDKAKTPDTTAVIKASTPPSPSTNQTEGLETNKDLKPKDKATAKKPIWDGTSFLNKPGDNRTTNCNRPIRAGGSINVSFTPREFPTPSRESMAVEEEEWLKKQREAMRKSGFNDADLRPEEKDPIWLLEKGKSLMKAESYLGAVSAFSTGLKLAPKMPELYAARAASQFALSNYRRAVEDSSQALEMLTPKVPQNLKDRLEAHTCRGNAFFKLNMYPEAVGDLSEALRLDPSNQKLQEEVRRAQNEADKEILRGDDSDE